MKIVFSVAPWAYGSGPLDSCLAVAAVARQRGHKCVFIASRQARSAIQEKGFPTVLTLNSKNGGKYPARVPVFFSDFLVTGGLGDRGFVERSVHKEIGILKDLKPDAVFSFWHVTLHLGARLLGIPVFAPTYFPDHPQFRTRLFPERRQRTGIVECNLNAVIRSYGSLDTVKHAADLIFESPATPISLLPRGFDSRLQRACGRTKFLGALWNLPGIAGATDLGVGKTYQRVVAYVPVERTWRWLIGTLPTCILSEIGRPTVAPILARKRMPDAWAAPGDLSFLSMLRQARVFICHGGWGGILTALHVGCPVVAIPGNDPEREYVSSRMEELGLGAVLRKLTGDALKTALERATCEDTQRRVINYAEKMMTETGQGDVIDTMELHISRLPKKSPKFSLSS